jgi:molybdopterin-guanine dinucleotide biosynthesis protein A
MTLTAVLLAGGESHRMGRDKAMLMVNGQPFWTRQIGLLRQLSPRELMVSARTAPDWLEEDIRFVADPVPARGPLGGIAAALAAMTSTHLLALAIDMPSMEVGHLEALWNRATPGCGVLPWLGDHAEPLAAVYPAEALPFATRMLTGDEFSMRVFTETLLSAGRMKRHTIGALDAKLYANCNSPADWQRHSVSKSAHD